MNKFLTWIQKSLNKHKILVSLSIILIIALFLTGWPQFGASFVKCGFQNPIMASPGSDFAGGTNLPYYFTPEDEVFYKPSYSKYYFCSEQDAIDNGVRPDPLSQSQRG